jgi:two-component system chemotaxis response regulator CheY
MRRAPFPLPLIDEMDSSSMRVLLVDDSGTMRTIIRRTLESFGVGTTVEAADGAQALELYKASCCFDLILTEWHMPGKTGIELVREIRALDQQVPIVMVTSESEKSRGLEAISAGITDYLVKPFTSETLRKKLERYTP